MLSSTTAEASAYRGRGGGGGGGGAPPEQDGQPMDEYQGPDEGVYMHTHTVLAPKDVSSCDECCRTVHFCLVLSVLLYRVRMQVCVCVCVWWCSRGIVH